MEKLLIDPGSRNLQTLKTKKNKLLTRSCEDECKKCESEISTIALLKMLAQCRFLNKSFFNININA